MTGCIPMLLLGIGGLLLGGPFGLLIGVVIGGFLAVANK